MFYIFHTPHFPHSTLSTLRTFHTPHFPHSTFSTLYIFHTPHFPYSALSTLRTPRFPPNPTVGRHKMLSGSHTWSCGDMNCPSQQAVWTGIQKTNFNGQQKSGETFPHLESMKLSRPWFSQNCRQNFGNNSFHFKSICCKHRHRWYNFIGVAQQRKPKFPLPWEIRTELCN